MRRGGERRGEERRGEERRGEAGLWRGKAEYHSCIERVKKRQINEKKVVKKRQMNDKVSFN